MQSVRVFPPQNGRSPCTVLGLSYDPAAQTYLDVEYPVAGALAARGWTKFAQVGATSERPPTRGPSSGNPITAAPGEPFVDTTLNAVVMFDGVGWRNVLTGAAV